MDHLRTKRSFVIVFMLISLFFGILMFATNHIDFIIAAVEYNRVNIPNLAYILLRIISAIILPMLFIVPSFFAFGRIRLGKAAYITMGVLYLLTTTWILYFLKDASFSELFGNEKIIEFQTDNSFVSSYVFWDTYSWIGVLYTIALGVGYIFLGINLDDNRIRVRNIMLAVLAAKIFLPMISNLITGNDIVSMFWLTNNYAELISCITMTIAFCEVSADNNSWIDFVWDQDVSVNDGFDDCDEY